MISMNVIVERIQYARTNGHNIGITYKINQFRTGYFCPKLVLIHKHEKKDFKIHPQSAAFFSLVLPFSQLSFYDLFRFTLPR